MADLPAGLIIAAPHSGAGKTLITLGLCRALSNAGISVAPAKTGPDYIDPAFLSRAARADCINLDPWGMGKARLRALAEKHSHNADLLLVEGVMGLFDGAIGGKGSTADLAANLGLPVLLVIDCSHMAQSVAAIASGFANFRDDVQIAGILLNRVASDRHEQMLRTALDETNITCVGAIRRDEGLHVPDRHLGLVMPGEIDNVDTMIEAAAKTISASLNFAEITAIAAPLPQAGNAGRLPPMGQRIAIARDAAFVFTYEHWLRDWHDIGSEISFFSPLNNETPDPMADAVFLPGGYPELHGPALAAATEFYSGLNAARDRGALIYGECGGYMVLGQSLTISNGETVPMAGLLPHSTTFDKPRRTLGYRYLRHQGPLPFARGLTGHEFHYSSETGATGAQLFSATDALGNRLRPMGQVVERVCGSYAHVIDVGTQQ